MQINESQLKRIIMEELNKVLREGITPEQRKALKAEYHEREKEVDDIDEKILDLGHDLEAPNTDPKQKRKLRDQIKALKEKQSALNDKQNAIIKKLKSIPDNR